MSRYIVFIFFVWLTSAVAGQTDRSSRMEKKLTRHSFIVMDLCKTWNHLGNLTIDSIVVNRQGKTIDYFLNPVFTQIPVRNSWIDAMSAAVKSSLKKSAGDYKISFRADGRLLEDYIPNAFRMDSSLFDKKRMAMGVHVPMLTSGCDAPVFKYGLAGSHIALWPSHGFFYDQKADRWQWQRARLWQTVEDILPWSFTSRYLVPMLENAGAVAVLPRERDTQIHEVIVDNDLKTGASELIRHGGKDLWIERPPGFRWTDTLFPGQNPFESGTSLSVQIDPGDTASLIYVPDIPENGDYAVYISYAKSAQCINAVHYEVKYSGGARHFNVNQCMGSGTWIYLGTFRFKKGVSYESGAVTVSGNTQGIISSDAVRFGGGMGNVARRPEGTGALFLNEDSKGLLFEDTMTVGYKISEKPRWMEGSRYYLQYAGMPDTVVYSLNKEKNDYNDDYMSRPEWVNYLIGTSRPQYTHKYDQGLNIPIDLVLAFHTDAGVTAGDSIIGTLGIYSSKRNGGFFPDGRSRLASRDLTDIIQSQVVDDIRLQVNNDWTRRGLWDREYSEAWRPVVPAMLLELMSHQNLADMKYGLDPRFRFIVARAVYKGILKYKAVSEHRKMVVQPLPPDHMAIRVSDDKRIRISWKPVADPLEPSAKPLYFKVYQSTEEEGFASGRVVSDTFLVLDLPEWNKIYSFKVTALNEGGESFSGETLSVALVSGSKAPVLVVNAFDRICGPFLFDKGDMAGIAWWEDEGVPFGKDFSITGRQYNYSRNAGWINDDSQGWGASYADLEAVPATGNTFSFPYIHGKALRDAGYSFVSVSDEVFEAENTGITDYSAVDIIFGEERGTTSFTDPDEKDFRVFSPAMIRSITRYIHNGGNLLISGAYIGTDMVENTDTAAIRFASDKLHYTWRTNHATNIGHVEVTEYGARIFPASLYFNTDVNGVSYRVESPDAIEPSGEGAFCIYRYATGKTCAGVAYWGKYKTMVLGFPFETINEEQRTAFMYSIMKFFTAGPEE